MTRADALARLAVCAAEARAALLACGLDDARARVLRVAETYAGPVRALPTSPGGDA